VRDYDTAGEHQLGDIPEPEREPLAKPDPSPMISTGYRNPAYDAPVATPNDHASRTPPAEVDGTRPLQDDLQTSATTPTTCPMTVAVDASILSLILDTTSVLL
jgi:hypothetical protein